MTLPFSAFSLLADRRYRALRFRSRIHLAAIDRRVLSFAPARGIVEVLPANWRLPMAEESQVVARRIARFVEEL